MAVPADALIGRFVEMLAPGQVAAHSKLIQNQLIATLKLRSISGLANENRHIEFLKKIYNGLVATAAGTVYSATGKRGTYGEVFSVAGKSTIVKKIAFYQGTDNKSFKYFFSLLKELLIQFILSNDPDLGVHVPKLHSVKRSGTHTLLVEMDKADYTFRDWLIDTISRNRILAFETVRPRIKEILQVLIAFNKKYDFAHRDFKLDNIMYTGIGAGATVKFIDFGMSCIGFTYGGAPVKIINDIYYSSTSTCKVEQDIGLFLLRFLTEMYKYLDIDFMIFLTEARAVNFKQHLGGLKSALQLDHRAYNKNGLLFGTAPVSGFFKPAEVMRLLGELGVKLPKGSAATTRVAGTKRGRVNNSNTRKRTRVGNA